ncbi:hypothetical protein LINPERHAP1_LOCUS31954 [Linum perenne]
MLCSADSESDVVDRTTDSIAPAADSISASQAGQIEESKAPADASHESRKRKQMKEEEMKEEDEEEKVETVYYPCTVCKCCARLAKTEFVAMPDDGDYASEDDDDPNKPGLRLRMIHYSRAFVKSGGFEVECPPVGGFGGIYNIEHFPYPDTLTDRKLAEHAIEEYNVKKGKKLNLGKIVNVTASCGVNMVYYLTFEALDSENDTIDTYQAIVSYYLLKHMINRVYVFRRKSDGESEHYVIHDSLVGFLFS